MADRQRDEWRMVGGQREGGREGEMGGWVGGRVVNGSVGSRCFCRVREDGTQAGSSPRTNDVISGTTVCQTQGARAALN